MDVKPVPHPDVCLLQPPATPAGYLGHGFVETYDHSPPESWLLSKLVITYQQQSLIWVWK